MKATLWLLALFTAAVAIVYVAKNTQVMLPWCSILMM